MNFKKKMWVKISMENLVLLYLLAFGCPSWGRSLEDEDTNLEKNKETVEEDTKTEEDSSTKKNEFSSNLETSSESTKIVKNSADLTSVLDKENLTSDASIFKPSVHLGEIQEARIRTNPFNKVHHVKFDINVDPVSYRKQFQNYGSNLRPVQEDRQEGVDENGFENIAAIIEKNNEEIQSTGRIKFVEPTVEIPRVQYANVLQDQGLSVRPITENGESQYDIGDQQIFQNLEKPIYEVSSIYENPVKFQSAGNKPDFGSSSGFDNIRSPYLGFYDYRNYQPVLHDYESTKKPDNNIVYVQESSFTRTRKFPYNYYQPATGHHEIQFVDEVHPVAMYPRKKGISLWKKIVHVIGAFLPLGLLLAALTPNVVKIDNSTQPNIVLSKLRAAELPVEHKQVPLNDESPGTCEDRSICELILAGGEAGSNVLKNILRNFSTRTPETAANEKRLRDVFEAAKKRDCTKIIC